MEASLCVSLAVYPFEHDLSFPDHAHGLAGEFRGLGFEMAGNLLVEPAMDLGGEVKDFDGHGFGPSSSQKLAIRSAGSSDAQSLFVFERDFPRLGVESGYSMSR